MISKELWAKIQRHLNEFEFQGWPAQLEICSDQSCSISYPMSGTKADAYRNEFSNPHFANFAELEAYLDMDPVTIPERSAEG